MKLGGKILLKARFHDPGEYYNYTPHSVLRNSSIKKLEPSNRKFFRNSTRLAGAH
jgi:hypothetical protein